MSNIHSIHHINYVVRDLEHSMEYFTKVLNQQPVVEELPERGVKTCRYSLAGTYIVLVQPIDDASEVADILRTRGEGLFLLSLKVDSLDAMTDTLIQKGSIKQKNARRKGLDNWKVMDLEQDHGLGPVLQLCEEISDKA